MSETNKTTPAAAHTLIGHQLDAAVATAELGDGAVLYHDMASLRTAKQG